MRKLCMLLAALAAAGCDTNVCSRQDSLQKTLNGKLTNCPTKHVEGTTADCENKLKKCTSDDQAKLNKWFDCMEELPDCAAGHEDEWDTKFLDCAKQNLQGLSADCQAGFSGG